MDELIRLLKNILIDFINAFSKAISFFLFLISKIRTNAKRISRDVKNTNDIIKPPNEHLFFAMFIF